MEHQPVSELRCEEQQLLVPYGIDFTEIEAFILSQFPQKQILRFTSSDFNKKYFQAHILMTNKSIGASGIFEFKKREFEDEKKFNVCFLIPTGIGCEIGGHAGDGTPALKLIAGSCDKVITHPNVVNASDINEMPENALYVEGSHLTQFLMGTIGLKETRKNRVLVIIDGSNKKFVDLTINSVNSARVTLGLEAEVICLKSRIKMNGLLERNKAVGQISNLNFLLDLLDNVNSQFDAIAVNSVINVPEGTHEIYSKSNGDMINPWGGVEAMLTHIISSKYKKPSAHAPMLEDDIVANLALGVVDPRIAPEIVSTTFFHCVLKGLYKAPKVVHSNQGLSVKDISAIVIPDNTLGLPVLAALHQGIKVIAVKNKNTMKNDLSLLPWKENQFFRCNNYLEANGILNCLRQGISIESVKRPIKDLNIQEDKTEQYDQPLNYSEDLSPNTSFS